MAQLGKEARKQAEPALDQAKDAAAKAKQQVKKAIKDATGETSGGDALKEELDSGRLLDSEKLGAVSDMLASTLGSGRL